jgi:hypothetical protein
MAKNKEIWDLLASFDPASELNSTTLVLGDDRADKSRWVTEVLEVSHDETSSTGTRRVDCWVKTAEGAFRSLRVNVTKDAVSDWLRWDVRQPTAANPFATTSQLRSLRGRP